VPIPLGQCLLDDSLSAFPAQIVDQDLGPCGCEGECQAASDALSGAGDRDPSSEQIHLQGHRTVVLSSQAEYESTRGMSGIAFPSDGGMQRHYDSSASCRGCDIASIDVRASRYVDGGRPPAFPGCTVSVGDG
jgi:hypothetical protein